jgi:tetratricopeptide (TPR) repeat protein
VHIHQHQAAAKKSCSPLHQLPSQPDKFIGRDEDLADLEKELTASNKTGVTISGQRTGLQGMGGVGKTALATVLAHRLKAHYPDAQLYLNLHGAGADAGGQHRLDIRPLTPADAMQRIIHTFYPDMKLPEDVDQLKPIYDGVLNDAGRVLLFLDNAANAEQVKPLLPPANCLLLVTSRNHFFLPGLATRGVGCLPPADSQKLLLTLAPRIKGHEVDAAELCGHLPLALGVFAGVVSVKELYLVPDLLKRLREGREKLTPVEAAFQVSYDLLADDLRRRWTALAVFPVSFDLAAAAAVWAEGGVASPLPAANQQIPDSAKDAMQTLFKGSLVEHGEANGRFRLHDLVRQFCDGKLTEAERTGLHLAHARHYTAVGEVADELYKTKSQVDGLALFDRERVQIEAAYSWLEARSSRREEAPDKSGSRQKMSLLTSAATEVARQMIALVNAVIYTSALRFHPRQRIAWLESQLRAAHIVKHREAEGAALGNLGPAYAVLGDTRKAIEFYEQALVIAREIGDRRGEGSVLGNLGIAYSALGDARKAIEFYEQALVIAREIGDRRGEGSVLGNLGTAYSALGDTRKAIEFHEQALVIDREIGDRHGEGCTLDNLGLAYKHLGDASKAIEFYEQALVITREIGDRRGEGIALCNSAVVHSLGDRAEAITRAEAALKIYEAIEDPSAAKVRAKLAEWRGSKP